MSEPLNPSSSPEDQVFAWLVEGEREEDIRAAIAAHFPRSNATKLLKAARARILALARAGPTPGWAFAALQDLYRRAVQMGELSLAARIVRDLSRIEPLADEDEE